MSSWAIATNDIQVNQYTEQQSFQINEILSPTLLSAYLYLVPYQGTICSVQALKSIDDALSVRRITSSGILTVYILVRRPTITLSRLDRYGTGDCNYSPPFKCQFIFSKPKTHRAQWILTQTFSPTSIHYTRASPLALYCSRSSIESDLCTLPLPGSLLLRHVLDNSDETLLWFEVIDWLPPVWFCAVPYRTRTRTDWCLSDRKFLFTSLAVSNLHTNYTTDCWQARGLWFVLPLYVVSAPCGRFVIARTFSMIYACHVSTPKIHRTCGSWVFVTFDSDGAQFGTCFKVGTGLSWRWSFCGFVITCAKL